MSDHLWPWVLSAVGLTGMWLAGKKRALGWYIGLGSQLLWIAFALFTGQLGFLLSAAGYGFVYARNAWRWTRGPGDSPQAVQPAYSHAAMYDAHAAPIFAAFHRDLDRWHAEITEHVQQLHDPADVLFDHRLAYDPVRCLGCSWRPADFAPAYTAVDQHTQHLKDELWAAYVDRKGPIRLCMP